MSNYKTPNVYVEEISLLPPSVAGVSTAVPAFIGYTEKQPDNSSTTTAEVEIRRITNFFEYKALFGGSKTTAKAKVDAGNNVVSVEADNGNLIMYYAVQHYFNNGGGPCYIVSVGTYDTFDAISPNFKKGIEALAEKDEPTLILLPDALYLGADKYYSFCQMALGQCYKLMDRFAIIDVQKDDVDADGNVGGNMKKYVGNHLSYGAAYYPYLQTTLNYSVKADKVNVDGVFFSEVKNGEDTLFTITYKGKVTAPKYAIEATTAAPAPASEKAEVVKEEATTRASVTVSIVNGELQITVGNTDTVADLKTAWMAEADKQGFDITFRDGKDEVLVPEVNGEVADQLTLKAVNEVLKNTGLYNALKKALDEKRVELPPSGAVAGAYASVDRSRGVWKAPANVSLNSVTAPSLLINDEQQGRMNIDSEAGKSINAIRSFAGKGTLIWGSRTLDGNSNEWRYVPVRRLFNYVEESIKKATAFAVFEPNTQITWLKVKSMIDSFLFSLWEQGAFSGSTKDEAYFINVGLGSTMTQQDILEGRMIIEIGLAAVRPAEFIILRFSHFIQES